MVYKEMVVTLVQDFVAGRNCCILAYGPHGTGKSHTLIGAGLPNENIENDDTDTALDNNNNDDRSTVSSLGSCGVSKLHVSNGAMNETVSPPTKPPNQVVANIHASAVHNRKAFSVTGSFLEETTTTTSHVSSTQPTDLDIDAGAILRTGQSIFEAIRKWAKKTSNGSSTTSGSSSQPKNALTGPPTVRCSYVKIIMEKTIDLLHPDLMTRGSSVVPYVTIQQQQPPNGPYEENASEVDCNNLGDVVTALVRGRQSRRAAAQRLRIGTCYILGQFASMCVISYCCSVFLKPSFHVLH